MAAESLGLASRVCTPDKAREHLLENGEAVAAVLALDRLEEGDRKEMVALAETLNVMTHDMMILADESIRVSLGINDSVKLLSASVDDSPEVLRGRLLTLLELRPYLRELRSELEHLQRVKQPLSSYFHRVDEEMHLAARLQHDFLPRTLPQVEQVRFASIYKPASWVSGDIYDVQRLDEEHVGFYIADVVGHGMPAALLTMFLKQAIVTKRINGHRYELLDPGETLARLNREFVAQKLSDFQFATCCYALLNARTLELRVANAGHPYMLRIDDKGEMEELRAKGALLGIFEDAEFPSETYQLHSGEKLLLYSDGIEAVFDMKDNEEEPPQFKDTFNGMAALPVEEMCRQLADAIEKMEGSLHQPDDITIVGMEVKG